MPKATTVKVALRDTKIIPVCFNGRIFATNFNEKKRHDVLVIFFSFISGRRDVLGIVQLQGFQGNWELDQSLATILGKSLEELKSSAEQQVRPENPLIYDLIKTNFGVIKE